jgi:hypothetical protein
MNVHSEELDSESEVINPNFAIRRNNPTSNFNPSNAGMEPDEKDVGTISAKE